MNQTRVIIIGGKESAVGAALLAKSLGMLVFVSDANSIPDQYKKELEAANISFEENGHSSDWGGRFDLMVVSPGVPSDAQVILDFLAFGQEVISEIEFASRHIGAAQLIGITGSNGKTTTTSLIYHILDHAKFNACLVGNIGISFARSVANASYDYYVCELSSFQLEQTSMLRPDVAIITNITADHLDRYDYDILKYAAAKYHITAQQQSQDWLILNKTDEISNQLLHDKGTNASVKLVEVVNPKHYISKKGNVYNLTLSSLRGIHNHLNIAMAIEATEIVDVSSEIIIQALASFVGPPHRMEFVSNQNDILVINDSKATNVDAVWYALDAMDRPVIWIAGGTDKGNVYDSLNALVLDKVKVLIGLGVDNTKLKEAFTGSVPKVLEAGSAEQAVDLAYQEAQRGDVILLSPACASFDRFQNYEERGDKFKNAVKKKLSDHLV